MPSVTWWNRVEPRPRTDDVIQPLQARVRDPLWMLTRQWQFGEFRGVDSGSPAWVTLRERVGAITGWQAAGGAQTPVTIAPLEQQIEAEPFAATLASRIELGQVLSRLLSEAGAADGPFRSAFPIAADAADPSDPIDVQLRRVCAGRAIDGVAAYVAVKANAPEVPPSPPAALHAFVEWVETTLGSIGDVDAPSWLPARLEYGASVAATTNGGIATLDVRPGDDGLIDWAAFDVASTSDAPALPAATRSIVPAHVRFKGMPNARFWDFEDGTLDFGDLKPDMRDLARLALVDFMLVHANDWFMLPVDVPVGSTHELESLVVRDVFGVDTLIDRADEESLGAGRWSMFSTAIAGSDSAAARFFLLPPSAGSALQYGRVVEEIRFARDEMANMVWAIENVLENAAGDPWPQHERDAARHPAAPAAFAQDLAVPLRYEVESRVPDYWIPFLPVSVNAAAGSVALERAEAIAPDCHTIIAARGRILNPTAIAANAPYQIPEEEVPRNGVRVQRLAVRSRWIDGSTRLWQLRRVQPGTGETSSALQFDLARPNPAAQP
jgi:hypothetical protein